MKYRTLCGFLLASASFSLVDSAHATFPVIITSSPNNQFDIDTRVYAILNGDRNLGRPQDGHEKSTLWGYVNKLRHQMQVVNIYDLELTASNNSRDLAAVNTRIGDLGKTAEGKGQTVKGYVDAVSNEFAGFKQNDFEPLKTRVGKNEIDIKNLKQSFKDGLFSEENLKSLQNHANSFIAGRIGDLGKTTEGKDQTVKGYVDAVGKNQLAESKKYTDKVASVNAQGIADNKTNIAAVNTRIGDLGKTAEGKGQTVKGYVDAVSNEFAGFKQNDFEPLKKRVGQNEIDIKELRKNFNDGVLSEENLKSLQNHAEGFIAGRIGDLGKTAEGKGQTVKGYVDAVGKNQLAESKKYTDRIGKETDSKIAAAETRTDGKIAEAEKRAAKDASRKATAAETNAKRHTDARIGNLGTRDDGSLKTVQERLEELDKRYGTGINGNAGEAVAVANSYTDQRVSDLRNELRGEIGTVRKEAREAGAVGVAMGNLRFADQPGKLSVSASAGMWRGAGAFAFGAGYTSEGGRVRFNVTGVKTSGSAGVGGGVSFIVN